MAREIKNREENIVIPNRKRSNKAGYCEYIMPKGIADHLLKSRKGAESKSRPNDYLCKVVNENYGLKEYCVKVTIK